MLVELLETALASLFVLGLHLVDLTESPFDDRVLLNALTNACNRKVVPDLAGAKSTNYWNNGRRHK
jgi:hypothetical protein